MWEFFGAYLTFGRLNFVVSQGAVTICNISVMRDFKAVGSYLQPGGLKFAEAVSFWCPKG